MQTPRHKIVTAISVHRPLTMKQIGVITKLDEKIVEAELACLFHADAIVREGDGYLPTGSIVNADLPF